MTHVAIVAWTAESRIAKYQDFPTEAEALAHVASVAENYPKAFAAPVPAGAVPDWVVDAAAGTVSLAPSPAPRVTAIKVECERRILEMVPPWRQRNMTRRAVQLERAARLAGGEAALTAAERSEIAALQAAADFIDATRAFSDILEASLENMAATDLAGFDPVAQDWPPAP